MKPVVFDTNWILDNPDFYCDNKLMLGKTHLRLGHKQEAKQWLTKTVAYNVYRPEDKQVKSVVANALL